MQLSKLLAALAALVLSYSFSHAQTPDAQSVDVHALKLERVVMLMRHGIRSPLKAQVVPEGVAAQDWAAWSTPIGHLTTHGAQAIALIAKYDRAQWAKRGLVPAEKCPPMSTVNIWSNAEQRTIETGNAWHKAAFPNCALSNRHLPEGVTDAPFEPFDAKTKIDPVAAVKAVMDFTGGVEQVRATYRTEFTRLGEIMGCCSVKVCEDAKLPAKCSLADLPGDVTEGKPGDRPKVSGVFDYSSTAAQTLVLQYLEGMPLKNVGWGRATPADLELVIGLHTMKANLYQRPFYIAQYGASLLARTMLKALEEANASSINMLVGHDSNINDLSGLLGFRFKVKSFANNVPVPGGALGFELMSDANGQKYVRGFYRAQTMKQMRDLEALTDTNPPHHQYLEIDDCRVGNDATICTLETFASLVNSKALPEGDVLNRAR
jgi:4-phytase/acid phosphatase